MRLLLFFRENVSKKSKSRKIGRDGLLFAGLQSLGFVKRNR